LGVVAKIVYSKNFLEYLSRKTTAINAEANFKQKREALE
jgi:hypothetical protein